MFCKVHSTGPCKYWDDFQISFERKPQLNRNYRTPTITNTYWFVFVVENEKVFYQFYWGRMKGELQVPLG